MYYFQPSCQHECSLFISPVSQVRKQIQVVCPIPALLKLITVLANPKPDPVALPSIISTDFKEVPGLAPGFKSLHKVTWEAVGSQKWVISMLPTQYSVTKPSCHCSQECSFFSTTVSLISIEIKCMYVIEFLCHIQLWDFPSILIVTKFELTAHICT